MPIANLVQSIGVASSAAAPASFTASYGSNTTAGSLLVAAVAVAASAAPTVSTPAGWSVVGSSINAGNTLGVFVFQQANTAGGFTAVAFTALTNVNGLAVLLWEVGNMNTVTPLVQFVAASSNSSSTIAPGTISPTNTDVLGLGMAACISGTTINAATFTPTTGAWANSVSGTSTVGATNVTAQGYLLTNSDSGIGGTNAVSVVGNFSGAVACGGVLGVWISTSSAAWYRVVDGLPATAVATGYAGGTGSW